MVGEGEKLSPKVKEMLKIFKKYESSKIDLYNFFKENISKITKGGC